MPARRGATSPAGLFGPRSRGLSARRSLFEKGGDLCAVRASEARAGIPTRTGGEVSVIAACDVVQAGRRSIEDRIDEADGATLRRIDVKKIGLNHPDNVGQVQT